MIRRKGVGTREREKREQKIDREKRKKIEKEKEIDRGNKEKQLTVREERWVRREK